MIFAGWNRGWSHADRNDIQGETKMKRVMFAAMVAAAAWVATLMVELHMYGI